MVCRLQAVLENGWGGGGIISVVGMWEQKLYSDRRRRHTLVRAALITASRLQAALRKERRKAIMKKLERATKTPANIKEKFHEKKCWILKSKLHFFKTLFRYFLYSKAAKSYV